MGGSGTRVVARIVERLGIFMGTNRNESEDAMDFVPFYDRWIAPYLQQRLSGGSVDLDLMGLEWADCVVSHRSGIPDEAARWGWKEPRTIYLLPFFHFLYPDLTFVHVIRDGRDMAFSSNQNQLRLHGPSILTGEEMTRPQPVQTAILWSRVNSVAADYAGENLPDRYLPVLFEDLCREPERTVGHIVDFLSPDDDDDLATVALDVAAPASIGRWRAYGEPSMIGEIYAVAGHTLRRFGYI